MDLAESLDTKQIQLDTLRFVSGLVLIFILQVLARLTLDASLNSFLYTDDLEVFGCFNRCMNIFYEGLSIYEYNEIQVSS